MGKNVFRKRKLPFRPQKRWNTWKGSTSCKIKDCNRFEPGVKTLCLLHKPSKCQFVGCVRHAVPRSNGMCRIHGGMQRCQHAHCTNARMMRHRGRIIRCPESCEAGCTRHRVEYCRFHFMEATEMKPCGFLFDVVANGGQFRFRKSCDKMIHHAKATCDEHAKKKKCVFSKYVVESGLGRNISCQTEIRSNELYCLEHKKDCQFEGCVQPVVRKKCGLLLCAFHVRNKICVRAGCKEFVSRKDLMRAYCAAHSNSYVKCRMQGCERRVFVLPGCKPEEKVCTLHGGGKRCKVSGCTKVIVHGMGKKDYCRAHAYELTDELCAFRDPETKKMCMEKRLPGPKPLCKEHGGGSNLCQMDGCLKVRTRLGKEPYCMAHGGGLECLHEGCSSKAIGGGVGKFCVKHGGGRRCEHEQCSKVALFGGKPYCREHGGGRKCQFIGGCKEMVQPGELRNLCVKHGGQKKCTFANCTKVKLPGGKPFCREHGGGALCEHDGCGKCRVGKGKPFCRAHGGGVLCQYENCTNLKSSGNKPFCRAHGGGALCEHDGCVKLRVSGGKPFCIGHGGGVSCAYVGCTTRKQTKEGFCGLHSKFKDREANRKPIT